MSMPRAQMMPNVENGSMTRIVRELSERVQEAEDAFDRVVGRLCPVLRDPTNTIGPPGQPAPSEVGVCEFSAQIIGNIQRLQGLIFRMEDVTDRLDT